MIRIASFEKDWDKMSLFVDGIVKDTVYTDLFKEYKLTKDLLKFYTDPSSFDKKICVISHEGDKDLGFATFDAHSWVNHDHPVKLARLSYIYLLPEARGKGYKQEIEAAFEYWAKKVGASHACIGLTKARPEVKKELKNNGYKLFETLYMKELK